MDGLWISYINKDIHAAIIPWSKYHLIKNHIVTNETKKRAHYGNALEYQNLQDRNPVEATEIQPYINKYGLQLLVHVGRRESHTQLQPNDFWIGTLSVIPI